MASYSAFPLEDQTDEDFFNNLVDDDFGVERSRPHSKEIVRDLSDLTLDDIGTSLEDPDAAVLISESNGPQQSGTSPFSDSSKKNEIFASEESATFDSSIGQVVPSEKSLPSPSQVGTQNSSISNSDLSRGTGIKEVQWSAFSVNSQAFDNVGLEAYSDFFAQTPDLPPDNLKSTADLNFVALDNQIQNIDTYTTCSNTEELQHFSSGTEQNKDSASVQYWESLYPGWKYDASTGQWYELGSSDATTNTHDNFDSAIDSQGNFNDGAQAALLTSNLGTSDDIYLQQTSQSALETISEESSLNATSNWNLSYQEFPANMVFDPQYPGWYYDTNTLQWYTLESYVQTIQKMPTIAQHEVLSSAGSSKGNYTASDDVGRSEQSANTVLVSQEVGVSWNPPTSSYSQQNMLQAEQDNETKLSGGLSKNQHIGNFYGSTVHAGGHTGHNVGFQPFKPVLNHSFGSSNGTTIPQNPVDNVYQRNNHNVSHSMNNIGSSFGNQNSLDYSQQPFQDAKALHSQFSYIPYEGRSSAGRPAHALVAFGFGGKLIIMKNDLSSGTNLGYGNQVNAAGAISILSLSEVVMNQVEASGIISGTVLDYFNSLCRQSFPGPLVGGNAATKDVNKWLDERILSYEAPNMEFPKRKLFKLLLSLLKISLQHYGKLRSPFGSDPSLQDANGPEMAVTKLFASSKMASAPLGEYGSRTYCLNNIPSESQLQATAAKVQSLLISGRKREALQCAQEGHLWGPALVLAAQLGEEFYVETVKKMAHQLFAFGSPLRSLCLLTAGKHADVFSVDNLVNSLSVVSPKQPAQLQSSAILDEWEENLAIITANRTKDDELVIIHLGDCLWKEREEVAAAHTCYLVAEANIEPYSESARLCLIGTDHWKYPRTYATPDAIQRTELYEYSKVLGNSQFILLPFQPYKIIYGHMLAEVGKISDSLKYCQAASKSLKNAGRAPELEMWKSMLSSLEDRVRTHQQGGYGSSMVPANLVGKLFNTFDRSIHRMIGAPPAPPAPLPPLPQGSVHDKENYVVSSRVPNSQSTMAMPSLVPSASVTTMTEWTNDDSKKIKHNRSVSEPDFGRSPKQDSTADDAQSKATVSGGSRFGRIGSHLLQKTIGWVSKSNRQAKLGEQNKFYYDEKLKRWVEEGVESLKEEPALPPPPTSTSFSDGLPNYSIGNAFKSEDKINNALNQESLIDRGGSATNPQVPLEHNAAIPATPLSQNQFSVRGRMGVRSRYVDTFNKDGGALRTNAFQPPAVPSKKPMVGAKFFVPTAPSTVEERQTDAEGESNQDAFTSGDPPISVMSEASFSSPPSTSSMQRFSSMDDMSPLRNNGSISGSHNGPLSRSRAVSWSGNYPDSFNQSMTGINPGGVGHGLSMFSPRSSEQIGLVSNPSLQQNGSSIGDDLHEVEL